MAEHREMVRDYIDLVDRFPWSNNLTSKMTRSVHDTVNGVVWSAVANTQLFHKVSFSMQSEYFSSFERVYE